MGEENQVIHKLFKESVLRFSPKAAIQNKAGDKWETTTYQELEGASFSVATFLVKSGLRKQECAALILENRPEWPMIYLGIVSSGLICLPLDPQLGAEETENLLINSDARIIFCSHNNFKIKLERIAEKISVKAVVLDMEDAAQNAVPFTSILNSADENVALPDVYPDDIASLIYTSGTTAAPKGVLLSHKNFCSNFISVRKLNLYSDKDKFISILPLYHAYSFMATLIIPLLSGATLVYCRTFKPQDIFPIIKEAKITILVGVPVLFSLLHKAIYERINKVYFPLRRVMFYLVKLGFLTMFRHLRYLVSGGARLEPKTAQGLFKLGFKIVEGYGLTETSPIVTLNPPRKVKFGSVGRALPDVEIKILNPDQDHVGQVLIKGPNVTRGYFKYQELNEQVLKDGWLYTSDFGYMDKEGYLFLTGRKEELIVLGSGKNIYPEELEEYYGNNQYIKEMCVVSMPERVFGRMKDSLYAVIVPNFEYFLQEKEVNIHEKIHWHLETLSKKLPPYKHIMGFVIIKEDLPRTPLKKIKRYLVKEKYLNKEGRLEDTQEDVVSQEDAELLNKETARKVIDYISGEVNKPVRLNSHLEIDLGIDSLTRVELGLGLEAIFKIKIPDELIYSVSTVKDIVVKAEELLGEDAVRRAAVESCADWGCIIKGPVSETVKSRIMLSPRFIDEFLAWVFKRIFLFSFRLFWSLRIEGSENLPEKGPYLICPNHASFFDGPVIFASLAFRKAMQTYFIGYHHIIGHPSIRWGMKVSRLIPIDASTHLTDALQAITFVLSHKKAVCIFPEGQRSIDTSVKKFKKGIGILIKELDIPVIPVYIKGSHDSWPRGSRFPRLCKMKVIFGRKLSYRDLTAGMPKESSQDEYGVIAEALRQEVIKLS